MFILDDSMVKNINGWSISENLKKKHNVYVRSFSGSNVRCMKDYAKPCIRVDDLDHIILQVGTNDLNSEKSAHLCSQSIVDLAKSLTSDKRKDTISGIIPRNDEWNNKAAEVNEYLRNMCKESEILFIDHGKRINPRKHLNWSKLHLSEKGSFILGKTFLDHVKLLFDGNDNHHCVNERKERKSVSFNKSIQNNENEFFGEKLKSFRIANLNRIIIAQININSIRNKSDALISSIRGNVDKIMISETKIDDSFRTWQFLIDSYTALYRLDRNNVGGGILVYVREDRPSKLISVNFQSREGFFLEINLRKKKWIIGFFTTILMLVLYLIIWIVWVKLLIFSSPITKTSY